MSTNDPTRSMFAEHDTGVSPTYDHEDREQAAAEDLDMAPGACRRVDGCPDGRKYHLRIGDLYLVITRRGISQGPPSGMHYDQCYGSTTSVSPGEAFAFLHGDITPNKTHKCMGCGATHGDDSTPGCSCPVGSYTVSTEWPDIQARLPRLWVDGRLVCPTPGQTHSDSNTQRSH